MGYRVGVDVGGTFTDFLVTDETGGARIYKTSTTPADPCIGFFRGIEKAALDLGLATDEFLNQVESIVHGTTITTNAALTGNGAVTGFVTTKGFRDVLNMRRGLKDNQFARYSPPEQLVPRHRIMTIEERVDVDGNIITPLNENDVREAAKVFRKLEVKAVAVSYLWSFQNPQHEERTREILEQELPGVYISISTEILPQIRVYERHSTTALNAYVGPILTAYISRLEAELKKRNFSGTLLIMQSNGGVMSPEVAQRFASNTLLSGPAGAPQAGIHYGSTHGFKNIITVDMGGTSFDISMVVGGVPSTSTDGSIGGHRIASPILDIHTVGSGGGSIAHIDSGGLLRVGPQSAGAEPGPACYGRGGHLPTTTDATHVLGYLNFEGGELTLNSDAAWKSIEEHIAKPLNIDVLSAAHGIYEIVSTDMAAALEAVSIQRGYDPREFVLVVAGGAGPLHAGFIAEDLGIQLVQIPRESSVFCAAGMLISDLKHDYVQTYVRNVDQVDLNEIGSIFKGIIDQALITLATEGFPSDQVVIQHAADLRYVGQFNEVEVTAFESGEYTQSELVQLVENYHNRHDALYGYSMRSSPIEIINLRVTVRGLTPKPGSNKLPYQDEDPTAAKIGVRQAYFGEGYRETPVFDGLKLVSGNLVSGPAIVVQPTTTVLVTPGFNLVCDEFNNYLMYRKESDLSTLKESLCGEV